MGEHVHETVVHDAGASGGAEVHTPLLHDFPSAVQSAHAAPAVHTSRWTVRRRRRRSRSSPRTSSGPHAEDIGTGLDVDRRIVRHARVRFAGGVTVFGLRLHHAPRRHRRRRRAVPSSPSSRGHRVRSRLLPPRSGSCVHRRSEGVEGDVVAGRRAVVAQTRQRGAGARSACESTSHAARDGAANCNFIFLRRRRLSASSSKGSMSTPPLDDVTVRDGSRPASSKTAPHTTRGAGHLWADLLHFSTHEVRHPLGQRARGAGQRTVKSRSEDVLVQGVDRAIAVRRVGSPFR